MPISALPPHNNIGIMIRFSLPLSVQHMIATVDVAREIYRMAYRIVIRFQNKSLMAFYMEEDNFTFDNEGRVQFKDDFWTYMTLLGNTLRRDGPPEEYTWHGYAGK